MKYNFHSAADIYAFTKKYKLNLYELCLNKEKELTQKTEVQIISILKKRLKIMERSIKKGLESPRQTVGKMGGRNAYDMQTFIEKNGFKNMAMGSLAIKAAMYAIANNENNACMGCIVACPTAGASGVLPGVLFASQEHFKFTKEELTKGFLVAAGIGSIIAESATLSGAEGGCQAEIGSAVAMTAAALTFMRKGTPEQCLQAAALGLKNLLGLACDPIGGMVEVPCIKRNAFGVQYAIFASDLALMDIKSFVPFDEVVEALKNISNLMSTKIRETSLGGLAITATGKKVNETFGIKIKSLE